eukprot:4312833-Pyramimonas_sp.AAC.1
MWRVGDGQTRFPGREAPWAFGSQTALIERDRIRPGIRGHLIPRRYCAEPCGTLLFDKELSSLTYLRRRNLSASRNALCVFYVECPPSLAVDAVIGAAWQASAAAGRRRDRCQCVVRPERPVDRPVICQGPLMDGCAGLMLGPSCG